MKSVFFTLLSSLTLTLLGPCFGAGLANAQGLTGKFTLPFEAHWGLATLQAGDYSFKLNSAPNGTLYVYHGRQTVALIYAQTFDRKATERAVLVVIGDGTNNSIREMALPSVGLILRYAPPRFKRGSAPDERQVGQLIPIAVTAGGR